MKKISQQKRCGTIISKINSNQQQPRLEKNIFKKIGWPQKN